MDHWKYVRDVYSKIYMKYIKELNKRRDILCSWIEKLDIVKMSVLDLKICCNQNLHKHCCR